MVAKSSVFKLCADFFDRYFHDEESVAATFSTSPGPRAFNANFVFKRGIGHSSPLKSNS